MSATHPIGCVAFRIPMNLLYAPFTKVEETPEGVIIEGIASTERVDSAGEVVDYDSLKAHIPDYEQWMNIRAMHQPIAAGKALVVTPDDEARTVYLRALIVDDDCIKKVRTQVYKGFSVGGKADSKLVKRADGSTYNRRFVTLLSEISLADRPSNPDARFTLVKMEAPMPKEEEQTTDAAPALDAETIAAIKKLAGQATAAPLAKASTDPTKIVAQIQQWRNEFELNADMDAAAMLTQVISIIQQVVGDAPAPAEGSPAEEATEPASEAQAEGDPAQMAAAAKPGNLRKRGAALSGARMAAMEQMVKTALQLMAGAGSPKAQKALLAMSDGEEMEMAAAIGAEFTKAVTPIASAILNVNERLLKIESQPAPGGPVLRRVEKVIAGQQPANQKPQATPLIKAQLDNLHHLARTSATAGMRADYQRQYEELAAQYQ